MGLGHADFIELFDQWAPSYDETVFQPVPVDGFEGYQSVLNRVAELAGSEPGRLVLDVGAGTGNLSLVLSSTGAEVVAVEPSAQMRRVAQSKLPQVPIYAGHFLDLPLADGLFDAVVSTYAFHHLTDEMKPIGMQELLRVVRPGGRLVIGDVAWADAGARQAMIDRAARVGKLDLVQEILDEYYPVVDVMAQSAACHGASIRMEQLSDWVWIFTVTKPGR